MDEPRGTEQDSPDPFGEMARAVVENDGRRGLPLRLCCTFVSLLGTDGGAFILEQDRPERTTVTATPDDDSGDRWPLFVPVGAALGPLWQDAFPMRTPAAGLGVATVYQRRRGPRATGSTRPSAWSSRSSG